MRTKAGFSLARSTQDDIDALAFATRKSKSEVVEESIAAKVVGLDADERRAFERARGARNDAPNSTPPEPRAA